MNKFVDKKMVLLHPDPFMVWIYLKSSNLDPTHFEPPYQYHFYSIISLLPALPEQGQESPGAALWLFLHGETEVGAQLPPVHPAIYVVVDVVKPVTKIELTELRRYMPIMLLWIAVYMQDEPDIKLAEYSAKVQGWILDTQSRRISDKNRWTRFRKLHA